MKKNNENNHVNNKLQYCMYVCIISVPKQIHRPVDDSAFEEENKPRGQCMN